MFYFYSLPIELVFVTGAGSVTLAAPGAGGAGQLDESGSGAATVSGPAAGGSGVIQIVGSGGAGVTAPAAAGAGNIAIAASGGVTLASPVAGGTGRLDESGAGAGSLAAPVAAGSGHLDESGSGAAMAGVPSAAGAGALAEAGAGGSPLAPPVAAGSGHLDEAGSGAATVSGPRATGVGHLDESGAGGATVSDPTALGSGSAIVISGSGAATLAPPGVVGVGALTESGAGSAALAPPAAAGAGLQGTGGAGAVSLPHPQVAGIGGSGGLGRVTLPRPQVQGQGVAANWLGAYSPTVNYGQYAGVFYAGLSWVALGANGPSTTVVPPGSNDAVWSEAQPAINWRGWFDDGTDASDSDGGYLTYAINDGVWYAGPNGGGQAWQCIKPTTGPACVPADNSPYWQVYSLPRTYAGPWTGSALYLAGEWVSFNRSFYLLIQANSLGQRPDLNAGTSSTYPGAWLPLSPPVTQALLSGTGNWDASTFYPVGAVVTYEGYIWQAVTAGTDQNPSPTSLYWISLGTAGGAGSGGALDLTYGVGQPNPTIAAPESALYIDTVNTETAPKAFNINLYLGHNGKWLGPVGPGNLPFLNLGAAPFGAIGDQSDETAIFLAALEVLAAPNSVTLDTTGGTLWIPPPRTAYVVTANLPIPNRSRVIGSGGIVGNAGAQMIQYRGSDACFTLAAPEGSPWQIGWNNATAYAAGAQVYYGANVWTCLVANTDQIPASGGGYWQLFGAAVNQARGIWLEGLSVDLSGAGSSAIAFRFTHCRDCHFSYLSWNKPVTGQIGMQLLADNNGSVAGVFDNFFDHLVGFGGTGQGLPHIQWVGVAGSGQVNTNVFTQIHLENGGIGLEMGPGQDNVITRFTAEGLGSYLIHAKSGATRNKFTSVYFERNPATAADTYNGQSYAFPPELVEDSGAGFNIYDHVTWAGPYVNFATTQIQPTSKVMSNDVWYTGTASYGLRQRQFSDGTGGQDRFLIDSYGRVNLGPGGGLSPSILLSANGPGTNINFFQASNQFAAGSTSVYWRPYLQTGQKLLGVIDLGSTFTLYGPLGVEAGTEQVSVAIQNVQAQALAVVFDATIAVNSDLLSLSIPADTQVTFLLEWNGAVWEQIGKSGSRSLGLIGVGAAAAPAPAVAGVGSGSGS